MKLYVILPILLAAILLTGCAIEEPPRRITGTITYIGDPGDIANMTGFPGAVCIDDDNEPTDDAPLRTMNLAWGSSTSVTYSFNLGDLPDGDYYVFFSIDTGTFWAYGYYNGIPDNAYGTRTLITVQDGAVINIEIQVT